MGTTINIEVDEHTLLKLVKRYLEDQVGAELDDKDIVIETKSKQNYRSEWERAAFRARVHKHVTGV
jgi:hypothetical protein